MIPLLLNYLNNEDANLAVKRKKKPIIWTDNTLFLSL